MIDNPPIDEGLRALSFVRQFHPKAILAGGYLRDCLLGVQPKDIDIFVPHPGVYAQGRSAEDYTGDSEVAGVVHVSGFALPVQVITLAPGLDVEDRVLHHDFGICQVWHDGTDLHLTDNFRLDVLFRRFTLRHCESQREFYRSMSRWARIRERFDQFALHIPQRFARFEAQPEA